MGYSPSLIVFIRIVVTLSLIAVASASQFIPSVKKMGRHLFLPIFVILMITSTFGKNLESDIVDDYESEENLESDIVNDYEPLNPFEENLDSDVDDYDPLNPFEVPSEETRATQTAKQLPVSAYKMMSYHNEWRAKAVTLYGASNMRVMWWNEPLAKQAQKYANKCIFGHSNKPTDRPYGVGENLYRFYKSDANYDPKEIEKRAIKSWTGEKDLPQGSFQPYVKGKGTGHWTQMIWAEANQFGCGLARCSPGKKYPKYKYTYQMVCQYSDGNMKGANAFELGQPCSKCKYGGCVKGYFGGVLCY